MATTEATPDEPPALLQAALAYAQGGLHVFPLHSIRLDSTCSCGHVDCSSPGKHPRTRNGLKDATDDPQQIDSWWRQWPGANIGVACGHGGLYVIDIDGPRGADSWRQLCTEHAGEPTTRTVRTGNGRHLWYLTDLELGNSASKLAPGIDTRGHGGYVVAPPSGHAAGTTYAFENPGSPLAQLPDWIAQTLTKPATTPAPAGSPSHDEHAARRLQGAAQKVLVAREGERNQTLNWAAYTAGRLIGAGRLHPDHVTDVLTRAARGAGLAETETRNTIASGIDAGRTHPDHDQPPTSHTPTPTAPQLIAPPTQQPDAHTDGPWAPVDLAPILDGTYEPPATTVLARNNGTCLLYPGMTNAIFGESESGKSWIALYAASQLLNAGRSVLYIDFEATAPIIIGRLAALGTPNQAIANRFAYIAPQQPLDDHGVNDLRHINERLRPELAVLDGITGAMGIHGWDPLVNSDVEKFDRLLPRPLAATGAAVLTVDHVPKSRDADSKYAVGAQHKRAAISGAAYRIDVIRNLAPGREGLLKLTISKDRHGTVRAQHPTLAGMFHLDSTDPNQLQARIEAPRDADANFRPTHLMESVSRLLEGSLDPLVSNEIVREIGSKRQHVLTAVKALVDEGYASVERTANGHLHRSEKPYRDEEM